MNKKLINICVFLMVSLFAVAPFVMPLEENQNTEMVGARAIPSVIALLAGHIRWGILGVMAFLSLMLFLTKDYRFKITLPVLLFSIFYMVQFLYALIDGYDTQRFFLLTVSSLLIPPLIGAVLYYKPRIINAFSYLIALFLILSLLLNGHLILSGQRFMGFLNNPNTYGISTVFWLVVLLLADQHQWVNKRLFYIVFIALVLTMVLSGSRNAMVGMALIVFLHYGSALGRFMIVTIIGLLAIGISSYFIDLSFVSDRLLNIADSYEDSGRSDIWRRAYHAIEANLWWGNGMNANQVVADTGNMHNCYIRFLLNMGLFFTLIALSFYGASVYKSFKKGVVPTVLGAFLLVYALMNIGEDFFVGLGSATFIYVLFIFGFINYYLTKNASTR